MNVTEGLARIRKYWPGVTFQMVGEERLPVMHTRLHALTEETEPGDLRELIGQMDKIGLGIRENLVILVG